MTAPPIPDRRLAPRPLAAHLTSAAGLWLSSRAALPLLKSGLLPSNRVSQALRALAEEIDGFGPDEVAGALDALVARRATAFLTGLEAYRRHPYRRRETPPRAPAIWREGATRLLDYGGGAAHPAVLVVPSLINRYYVLDLLPQRSFLRHLAGQGLRPLVVDWGTPGAAEAGFDLSSYVDRLHRAFAAALQPAAKPVAVVGYCMGGLMALALGLRRQSLLACLALLATPWDFHAERTAQARLLGRLGERLPRPGASAACVPVDIVQSLFFLLDPFLAERKFVRFAGLDPAGDEARGFVALEDWINDGAPLALAVARDCLHEWYGENAPARGAWRVGGLAVRPQQLRRPALVVIPGRDRVVPPRSAEPLTAALRHAEALRPPLGHVGMMSSARAPELLWTPIAQWLRARLGPP